MMSGIISRAIVGDVDVGSPREHFSLSDREDQILCLVWQGKTELEMAHDLDLSLPTVRQYKRRLQVKVGAARPGEIIKCALDGTASIDVGISARREY